MFFFFLRFFFTFPPTKAKSDKFHHRSNLKLSKKKKSKKKLFLASQSQSKLHQSKPNQATNIREIFEPYLFSPFFLFPSVEQMKPKQKTKYTQGQRERTNHENSSAGTVKNKITNRTTIE